MTEGIRKRFSQVINMEAPVGPTEHNAIFSSAKLSPKQLLTGWFTTKILLVVVFCFLIFYFEIKGVSFMFH